MFVLVAAESPFGRFHDDDVPRNINAPKAGSSVPDPWKTQRKLNIQHSEMGTPCVNFFELFVLTKWQKFVSTKNRICNFLSFNNVVWFSIETMRKAKNILFLLWEEESEDYDIMESIRWFEITKGLDKNVRFSYLLLLVSFFVSVSSSSFVLPWLTKEHFWVSLGEFTLSKFN